MKIKNFINKFEQHFPIDTAMVGDPVGLQIGNINQNFSNILVTLDVRPEVVQEAIDKQCNFIFSHHPALFRPLKKVDFNNPQHRMYMDIIQNKITVYSAHTNLDVAEDGMNLWLSNVLNLNSIKHLFVYKENTNLGKIGFLNRPLTVEEFSKELKNIFNLDGLKVVTNDKTRIINKVAVIGGDGGKYYPEVLKENCDAFITGDVYYHTAHDMLSNDLNVFDVGHNVEKICINNLAKLFKTYDETINVLESHVNTDPYNFY